LGEQLEPQAFAEHVVQLAVDAGHDGVVGELDARPLCELHVGGALDLPAEDHRVHVCLSLGIDGHVAHLLLRLLDHIFGIHGLVAHAHGDRATCGVRRSRIASALAAHEQSQTDCRAT
jgi:hypothetical protein